MSSNVDVQGKVVGGKSSFCTKKNRIEQLTSQKPFIAQLEDLQSCAANFIN